MSLCNALTSGSQSWISTGIWLIWRADFVAWHPVGHEWSQNRFNKSIRGYIGVPVMKGRKWYSLKKDLQPFITWTSISTIKFVNT